MIRLNSIIRPALILLCLLSSVVLLVALTVATALNMAGFFTNAIYLGVAALLLNLLVVWVLYFDKTRLRHLVFALGIVDFALIAQRFLFPPADAALNGTHIIITAFFLLKGLMCLYSAYHLKSPQQLTDH
jgi:hypothetical protein